MSPSKELKIKCILVKNSTSCLVRDVKPSAGTNRRMKEFRYVSIQKSPDTRIVLPTG